MGWNGDFGYTFNSVTMEIVMWSVNEHISEPTRCLCPDHVPKSGSPYRKQYTRLPMLDNRALLEHSDPVICCDNLQAMDNSDQRAFCKVLVDKLDHFGRGINIYTRSGLLEYNNASWSEKCPGSTKELVLAVRGARPLSWAYQDHPWRRRLPTDRPFRARNVTA